ncbi:MAG: ABC transporter permease, partial [Holophagales bacterium]|nr:ABC transporter permease [Holophagales bacterium]
PVGATGISAASAFVFTEAPGQQPYGATLRLCHTDFFRMFDVPFRYGGGWDDEADRERRRVVVLTRESNDRLFGGEDSVGRTVRIGGGDFTVVGVLDAYRPTPQYYDVINNPLGKTRDFFVPFDTIREQDLALTRIGDSDNWGPMPTDPDARFTASEQTWIQFWAELEPGQVAAYEAFVDAYTVEQKTLGRFPRPINNRVTPLMEWMAVREVTPTASRALVLIGLLFLVVCCLNLLGLLLGKFLARSGSLGVHRALGASRRSIFLLRLVECEVVGLLGGAVGVGLVAVALRVLDIAMPDRFMAPNLFQVDTFSLGVAVGLALLAGLLSGLYPAWRACRVAPALQLKLQ